MKYTVTQYAAKIGVTRAAVQKQINAGKLKAEKIGNVWIIYEK